MRASLLRRLRRRRTDNRAEMLNRVFQTWIEGVLDYFQVNQPRIELGLARWLKAVPQDQQELRQPGHELQPLPAATTATTIFNDLNDSGRGLLILGQLGSGKTTALLELTRELIKQARTDPTQRMPVVFNLSSWTSWAQHHDQPQFGDWLVEELHHSYEVPRRIAEAWIDDGEILPLLDGLDEVAEAYRAGCVEAINAFRDAHYFGRLVVCSGIEEYEALPTPLRVDDAVVLQPLTRQQIDHYLQTVNPPAVSIQQALVHADQALWELLSSPLMLSIATQVYRGRRADTLLAPGTVAQRRRRLVAEYIKRERQPATDRSTVGRYRQAHMKRWLSWLARSMRERGLSEFDLDRLQPDWLPNPTQRRLVTVVPAIVSAVVGGLGVGLSFRSIYAWTAGLNPQLVDGLGYDLDAVGLIFGLMAGLVFALIAVIGGRANQPVRALRWPWVGWGGGLGAGLVVGLITGPVMGLLVGLVALGGGRIYALVRSEETEGASWSWADLVKGRGLSIGIVAGLCFGLGIGLGFGGGIGLVVGLAVLVVVGLVVLGNRQVYELVRDDGIEGALPVIYPVEELRWSSQGLASGLGGGMVTGLRYYGLRVGLVGLSVGLSGLLGRELSGKQITEQLDRLSDVLGNVLGFALVVGLGVGLAVGLVNGLINGMVANLAAQHVEPNEGIRRSRRHAVRIGLLLGVIVGLISGLVYVLAYALRGNPDVGWAYGLVFGVGVGLVYGLGFGLEFGGIAYLRHLALRALLVWNRAAPWRYQRFLNEATERRFLRKSGGSYSFVDRFLSDSFAEAVENTSRERQPP
jgi:hypothetical protein